MPKTFTIAIIIFITVMILFGLSKQISDSLKVSKRLDDSVEGLSKLQDENRDLKKKLSETDKYSFVEEIARNKLNYSRSNETVMIIPDETIRQVLSAQTKVEPPPKLENWQGWLKLFMN